MCQRRVIIKQTTQCDIVRQWKRSPSANGVKIRKTAFTDYAKWVSRLSEVAINFILVWDLEVLVLNWGNILQKADLSVLKLGCPRYDRFHWTKKILVLQPAVPLSQGKKKALSRCPFVAGQNHYLIAKKMSKSSEKL